MLLGRKDFLVRTGLLVGAGALAAAGCRDEEQVDAASQLGTGTWGGVRAAFSLDPELSHFAAFLLASHPKPVQDAIAAHRRRLDESAPVYLHENELRLEAETLQSAAAYLGAGAEDVALTDSTTMGLGLLYATLQLAEGEEIVTTEHDFYSTHESLRLRAERTGGSVRRIRLYEDLATVSDDEIVDAVRRALTPRTRAVALTWVHSSTGLKLPLRAIADAIAEEDERRGAEPWTLLCVDAVHGLGVEDEPVTELGCDFLVSGCHKWLFGPRGTGIVWGRPEAWARVSPTIPSFTDPESFGAWVEGGGSGATGAAAFTPGGFHAFEHRWALAQAFDFQRSVEKRRVRERTHALARRLKAGLADLPGIVLHTPMTEALSAGLVCFEVGSRSPEEIVESLQHGHGIVASVTPYASRYVRFGTSIVNSEDEVDAALAALRELA
ncbi:MAG TPA: aminotransferase class V-fold PLP-dependent enzyme [Gaiellaceae bacterium]|nr:aminotransferase class V-fold PLP-dependent enzyme [Gaiellaceae bacterium]